MSDYLLAKDMVALQTSLVELDYKLNLLLEAAGVIKKEEEKKGKK